METASAAAAQKQVITYLVLTFVFSSWFYYLIISAGKMKMGPTYGLMWSPGVAALLTRLIYQRNLRGFGWGWGKTRRRRGELPQARQEAPEPVLETAPAVP